MASVFPSFYNPDNANLNDVSPNDVGLNLDDDKLSTLDKVMKDEFFNEK